jgi:transcriptional regulator of acetoin/glycerol metabolism
MGYRYTDFPYLMQHTPDEVADTLLHAVKENAGNVAAAAEYVGLDRRHFYNYVNKLGLLEKVKEIRDQFKTPGRQPRLDRQDNTWFGSVVRETPEEAKALMVRAFHDNGANAVRTAESLGISAKRFYTYVRQFDLFPELQREVARRSARDKASRGKLRATA